MSKAGNDAETEQPLAAKLIKAGNALREALSYGNVCDENHRLDASCMLCAKRTVALMNWDELAKEQI